MTPAPRRSWTPSVLTSVALMTASVCPLPIDLDAQQAPRGTRPPATDTLTAAVLKRAGEAVDGYRTGETVWIVISFAPPYRVDTVVGSYEVALRRSALLDSAYHVLGPFRTATDFTSGRPMMLMPLCHDWDSDPCDNEFSLSAPAWEFESIDSVTVSAFRGGEAWRHTFSRGRLDALFLTLAAADKFYFPYLVRLYGVAFADSVRNAMTARFRGK